MEAFVMDKYLIDLENLAATLKNVTGIRYQYNRPLMLLEKSGIDRKLHAVAVDDIGGPVI
jgi:hypothetical protein